MQSSRDKAGQKRRVRPAVLVALLGLVAIGVFGAFACRSRSREEAGPAPKDAPDLLKRADEGLRSLASGTPGSAALPVAETLSNRPKTKQAPPVQKKEAPEAPPPEPPRAPRPSPPPPVAPAALPEPPRLKGIIWQPDKPLALINKAVVGKQEQVDGFTVVDIARETVVLRDGKGQTIVLSLYGKGK